jgi:signal transduction histidine kinase
MWSILKATVPIGFAFGIVFSLVGYMGLLPFESTLSMLWLLPLVTAILCGIGGLVAANLHALLDRKAALTNTTKIVIAFLAAAVVNFGIVFALMSYYGILVFERQMVLGSLLGLLMGVVYAGYRYTVDTLKERMQFLEALTDKNKQLQEASRRLAIIEERNRMSRELHDSVSQGLHGLVFAIHSLRNEVKEPSERAETILNHMEATANATLDELRTMIEELKPSLLAERGLEEALRTIAELFAQRNSVPVEFDFAVPHSLPAGVETTIYRISQEALANIERHASAKSVSLRVGVVSGSLMLTVRDDGKGFDTRKLPPGNGLANMRQRVEERGGTFQIISKSGLGTSVVAEFPSKG